MEALNTQQRRQALDWYVNKGYDLSTIAQHFGITRDQLAGQLNTVVRCKEAQRCL